MLPIHRPQRNWGPRIREVTYQGLQTILLENERLRFAVLAGKGSDVVEFLYKPCDLDFAWLTPGGVRNPLGYASTSPDPLATFLDFYPGGWQEIFPNGGAPSSFAGAQFGQHGEVCHLPWDAEVVEDGEAAVAARFSVRGQKVPCCIEKTVRLGSGEATVTVEEVVRNESPVAVRAMWGQHITFGQPFLRPRVKITLPDGVRVIPHNEEIALGGRRIGNTEPFPWPRATSPAGEDVDLRVVPESGTPSEVAYLTGFPTEGAWYEIVDEERGIGCRVEWDASVMPYLWFWQEFGATTGYPWYGRAYVVGLEPFSSYPTNGLLAAVANDSAMTLAPGEERHFRFSATVIER